MQPLSSDYTVIHSTSFGPSLETLKPELEGWDTVPRTGLGFGTTYALSRHVGEYVEKTFELEANTGSVAVEFSLFELGQWDAEVFSIHINGRQIDLQPLTYLADDSAYSIDLGEGIVLEKSMASGRYAREHHSVRLTIEEPGDALTLGFSSNLDGSLDGGYFSNEYEAWAVDNLKISTKPGEPELPVDKPAEVYEFFDDGSSPVESVTYNAETGVLDLVIDQQKLFQDSGEWGNVRHIDYVRFDGQMYGINIHGDNGPRNPDGSYIYDETTTENVFSINIGKGLEPADGIMNFELHDYEDGSKVLYEFQMSKHLGTPPVGLLAAVNAGGEEYTTIEGITYAADTSGVRSYAENQSIAGTLSDTIYTSENSSWDGFTLETDLKNGFYDVELKFAEIWGGAKEAGMRSFDLKVEDEFVFQDLDLSATAGFATALDFVGTVEVKDGALTIEGINGLRDAKISGYSIWETDATETTAFEVGNILNYRADVLSGPQFIKPTTEETGPTSLPTPFADLVAAVNTGGGDFTTADGLTYAADTSGQRSYEGGYAIEGTEADGLYQSETSQWNGFVYETEVDNGLYDLELKFAEIWHGAMDAGVRTFSLKVEDEFIFEDLDLTDTTGFATAMDYVGTVEVSDGALTIEGINGANWAKIAGYSIWESDKAEATEFAVGDIDDYRTEPPLEDITFV